MRRLMWFSLGFSAACGLCAYLLLDQPLLLAAGAVGCGVILAAGGRKKLKIPVGVLLGAAAGFAWYSGFCQLYLSPAAAMDGTEVPVTAIVSDYSREGAYGTTVDGVIMCEGRPFQVRLYLKQREQLKPGDRIASGFCFRLTTANGAEDATYHRGKGIFLLGYQRGKASIQQGSCPWWGWPAVFRQQIRQSLSQWMPEDVFPFAKALLLGDSSDLSYETDVNLQLSGIRHLVAVSGLHVSFLYGFIRILTLKKRRLTALVGLPCLLFFAASAGFTPSVVRASIMVGLMMLASAFDREYDPLTELSFAALVMLMGNPLTVTSVSFQLSVTSVLSIVLFGPGIREYLLCHWMPEPKKLSKVQKKWISGLAGGIGVSVSALILVTPLCAFYFGTVSLISVVTNLLTVWMVGYIFCGLILLCGFSLFFPYAAGILAWITTWMIRYVLFTADLLAAFPLSAVYTCSPYIRIWLLFIYTIIPFSYRLKQKALPVICGMLGLLLAVILSWAGLRTDDFRATVLDIGQGQCILIQSEGKNFLVDCGGDYDREAADLAAETLLSQGIGKLDGVFITHYDRDHVGGARLLLTRMDADLIMLPTKQDTRQIELPTDAEIIHVESHMELNFGSTNIRVYGGLQAPTGNENSLCVLFDTEKYDILITGDRSEFGEKALLAGYDMPDVDCLIAGHHGSRYSTCQELLETVKPETVIISAGKGNPYGHPAPELLERLQKFRCRILRTDLQGTIIIRE